MVYSGWKIDVIGFLIERSAISDNHKTTINPNTYSYMENIQLIF